MNFRYSIPVIAALALAVAVPVTAQDYEVFGSLTAESGGVWYGETYALLNDLSGIDRIDPDCSLELSATHRFSLDGAEFVIDHTVGVTPDDAESVTVHHELYQAYLSVDVGDRITVGLGRQRLNWGAGFSFSSTDALHPQSEQSDVEVGFDGASLAYLPGPDLSVEAAVALQEALDTDDVRDLRAAVLASWYVRSLELGGAFVYQDEEIFRPGILATLPLGPVLLFGEGAVEYFATEGAIDTRLLANAAVEYSIYTTRLDVIFLGEYRYNGLADESLPSGGKTRHNDNAGDFDDADLHYGAAEVSVARTDYWNISNGATVNLVDGSALFSHEVVLTTVPSVDFGLGAYWTGGEGDTEFGALPAHVTGRAWVEVHW